MVRKELFATTDHLKTFSEPYTTPDHDGRSVEGANCTYATALKCCEPASLAVRRICQLHNALPQTRITVISADAPIVSRVSPNRTGATASSRRDQRGRSLKPRQKCRGFFFARHCGFWLPPAIAAATSLCSGVAAVRCRRVGAGHSCVMCPFQRRLPGACAQ